MYLGMTAFLTVMLSVFLIVAWSVIGNIAWHYRQGRTGRMTPEGRSGEDAKWRLPVWKAVPMGLVTAWLIVHFFIRP